ncbi:CBO0543 family protein [Paenibacillus sp.]|uniref:CBO0543 family protein n=1 Tax=Paenibacillus sp. TaxID=58172 RepID=UPI0028116E9C|nr:CBO0543 family protein [Paenibacillus sp.]
MDALERIYRQSQELQRQLTDARETYFFNEVVHSYQWWLMLAALVVSYTLLWFLIDRSRLVPILLVGWFVFGVATAADGVGGDLVLWDYPRMGIPWGERLLQADLVMPVGYMLTYQWYREWKPFFVACVALAVLYAFVLEPFAIAAGVYETYLWRHVYSFPIYVAIGLFVKWMADAAERVQTRNSAV